MLGPVATKNGTVPYPDLANAIGTGIDSPICQGGNSGETFPVGLRTYNISTNRAVYDLYKRMVNEEPGFNNSAVQFENYPVRKMQSVPAESTAYPHRDDNWLAYVPFFLSSSCKFHAIYSSSIQILVE